MNNACDKFLIVSIYHLYFILFSYSQDELTRLSIGFIQEETWRHLISEVPSFGEICVTEANSKKAKQCIRFKRSEYGANLEERLKPVPTSRKFIFPTSKLNNGAKIRNACFLPDDRLVLISFNENCIYVCNKDGDKKKRIPLPFKPSDITLYDKHNSILANGTRIQSFKTDSFTFGQHVSVVALNDVISSANNQIAIRSPSGSISVMDIEGKLGRQIQTHSYGQISMDRFSRVYYSNNAKHEVHCFYPDGSHCCIYRHEDLKDPSGMTTDDLGNVYVAGHMSHNIHKISAQGKRQEIILSSKDGINYPQRIAYNEKTHELLVINCEWRSVEIYQFK
jgi:hypothetical protein